MRANRQTTKSELLEDILRGAEKIGFVLAAVSCPQASQMSLFLIGERQSLLDEARDIEKEISEESSTRPSR